MTDSDVIPLVDLRAAHAEIAGEIDVGMRRVIADTSFIKGPDVMAFEQEYAAFSGVPYCVGVASGTDALELALRAAEIPPGSEVVVPANTFVATAEAVIRAGARPVFVDVDPGCLLIDPAQAAAALRPQTSAVLPVHLYGQLASMKEIADVAASHGVAVIEDAAQAHGATQWGNPSGALGMMAATSFYPGKNLGAYGDAGAVLTGSARHAHRLRLLADHGSERKYEHATLGFNSRLDSLQAAVLRVKLRRLAEWNDRRRQAARRYDELLAGIDEISLPQTAAGNEHVWHLYVIQVPRRDAVLETLRAQGIQAGIHYPVPVHLQSAFQPLGYGPGDFPVAEAAAARILSLPLHPHIDPAQQRRVAGALRRALAGR